MSHVVHSQMLQWIPQGTYDGCHWLHSPLLKVPVQEGRSWSSCIYSVAMSLASMACARCKDTVQCSLESSTELWTRRVIYVMFGLQVEASPVCASVIRLQPCDHCTKGGQLTVWKGSRSPFLKDNGCVNEPYICGVKRERECGGTYVFGESGGPSGNTLKQSNQILDRFRIHMCRN